jgi:hypothetical protein
MSDINAPTDTEREIRPLAMALKAYRERTKATLSDAITAFGPCACGHRAHMARCNDCDCTEAKL